MSKRYESHYVPWNDRKWVICRHPLKNCTAMGTAGMCGWNTALSKCEYGQVLSPEEIKIGIEINEANFQVLVPATGE